jgi:pimeloyl-ACP methyl ester carboxylesterase
MRFWRSPLGALAVVLLLAAGGGIGATAYQVFRQTAPRRATEAPIDFESMMVRAESVRFPSTDGIDLAGWLIRGAPDRAPIVLCHDLGSSKASLVNVALALSRAGFTVLMFDFRAHGDSAGERSSLGVLEKRDVVGAVDFLGTLEGLETKRIGVFGVGMGAHAAVLAAADRPVLRVLVLDGLYPDASYELARRVYLDWSFAVDHLSFVSGGMLAALNGSAGPEARAADVIGHLLGRDLLFLAPASDTRLADEMMRMYETVPDQADADGNLVVLPATHADGLYASDLTRYHERVAEFFSTRLGS